MITHGSSYKLLGNLKLLDDPICPLGRDDQLKLIRNDLKKNIRETYECNRHKYNLRARPISFKVGQEVYRRNFTQSNFEKQYNACSNLEQ